MFGHREHVRLAWLVVRAEPSVEAATGRVRAAIQAVARAHGQDDRYHETVTTFWVRLVVHAVQARRDIDDFDVFVRTFPLLLDPASLFRHWRRETILASSARHAWVEPDLASLPRL